jgi:hypothetical protein
MALFNIYSIEQTTGCTGGCSFCAANASPVKTENQAHMPIDELIAVLDEMYDTVGELTGQEKLQIGSLQRIMSYMGTDSFDYQHVLAYLRYLKTKGVSSVSLSSIIPEHGEEAFKVVAHHLWLKNRTIPRLRNLDDDLTNRRRRMEKNFPKTKGCNLDEALAYLAPYNELSQLLPIVDTLVSRQEMVKKLKDLIPPDQIHDGSVYLSYLDRKSPLSGRNPQATGQLQFANYFNNAPKGIQAIADNIGLDPETQTIDQILVILRAHCKKLLHQTDIEETLPEAEFAFSFIRRRTFLKTSKQIELSKKMTEIMAITDRAKRLQAMGAHRQAMAAIHKEVDAEIPQPPIHTKLRRAEVIRSNYEYLEEEHRLWGVESLSELEARPDRATFLTQKREQFIDELEDFPEQVGLRVSAIPRREEAVRELQKGPYAFLYESRQTGSSFYPRKIGRSFQPGSTQSADKNSRNGLLLTPTGLDNTVRGLPSLDNSSSHLRVAFVDFEDNPTPAVPGTDLMDLLPHLLTTMSKLQADDWIISVYDGVNIRQITYDPTAFTVMEDRVIHGPIESLEDIQHAFNYRGTMMEQCTDCTGCFGLIPKEEI